MTRATITPAEFAALSKRKGHKYGARKTEYRGMVFDSAAEAKQAQELDIRKKAGDIMDWERQVPFPIRVNDVYICTLIFDFRVIETAKRWHLLEVKGMETPVYKLKLKLFRACWPGVALHVVKA